MGADLQADWGSHEVAEFMNRVPAVELAVKLQVSVSGICTVSVLVSTQVSLMSARCADANTEEK